MRRHPRSKSIRRSIFKRRWFLSGIALLVVIAAGGATYAIIHRNHITNSPTTINAPPAPNNKIDYSPASPADNTANNNRKASGNPTSTIDSYQAPPNSGTFSVSVTRAGVDSSGQNLQVATLINGVSSGICTLNVHQAGQQTISKSEDVVLQVNSYVCPVINIPLSQFPDKGSWNVTMTVESNGKTVSVNWANNPVAL